MKKITELEIQKKNKKRVSVYLDDTYAFSLDIMTASSLSRGQKITSDKIEELKDKDAYSRALNNATRFLAARARSIKEMEVYLNEKEYSKKTVSQVIDKLIAEKYLNDREFAKLWVESRVQFNPKGSWALKQELRQKGITDDDIETTLSEHDDELAAWKAVQKKIPLWQNLEPDKMRKKLYTFLSNRGFNYETTHDIYQKIITETEDLS